jgi:hypothetical protein
LFKGATIPKEEISIPSTEVRSIGLHQRNQEKAYTAKTPKLLVKVDGTTMRAMLDTRAKVNVITCLAAKELGLPICIDILLALKVVSRDT